MEFVSILLSSLLALISPVGLIVDRLAENAISSQLKKVDQLQVRVDNAPSYQLLQGKVERVRIAGRGLKLKQIRIAALEVETDPINLKPRSLGQRQLQLKLPFQAGVRLVLTQADINQALQSPGITASLRKLSNQFGSTAGDSLQGYNFVNPRVEFLANNRLRFQVELTQANVKALAIKVESGLGVIAGRQIQLTQPIAWVNGEEIPSQFVNVIATSLGQQLDLGNFDSGLQARILQLKIVPQQLEIAAFLRVEPSSPLLRND